MEWLSHLLLVSYSGVEWALSLAQSLGCAMEFGLNGAGKRATGWKGG